ncbi:MAG TPA: T9SS type B sorting domain-containing protein, partial [Chitinophagaceae bacterium]
CFVTDSVTIRVSPYPVAKAGGDTSICYGDKLRLEAFAQSDSFKWTPDDQMLNGNTLQPFVAPNKTSAYVLTATGYQECPKAVSDTITVIVRAPVQAFGGNDTAVVVGQPLVLHATGGVAYLWSPGLYLDATDKDQPTAIFGSNLDSIRYTVNVTTAEGCSGRDDILVMIYKTAPDIFIPDAFTPNNDRLNDLFYPVVTGMKQFDFFKVYNRYGQLLYSSQVPGQGWDGSFGGKPQPPGTYVYMAQAVNYKGEKVFRKGTVVLIR